MSLGSHLVAPCSAMCPSALPSPLSDDAPHPGGGLRRHLVLVALAAVLLATGPVAAAASIAGRVVRVVDGDSLYFKPDGGGPALEVRLRDIDAPEICQAGGPEAKRALIDIALGGKGRLEVAGKTGVRDRHGRLLGTLVVGAVHVNRRMVEDGHAWSARFKWDRGPYMAQERMAKALSRGLHAAGGAVNPKDFRQRHGPCRQK
jgi:micrococcal nuclease